MSPPTDGPQGRCETAQALHGIRRFNPLDLIEREHAVRNRLCSLLEEIADALPDRVVTERVVSAVIGIRHHCAVHVLDEEGALFPLLRRWTEPDDYVEPMLEILSQEHQSDLDFALEVVEALESLSTPGDTANPNMIGYMLRGFFEQQRRHNAWEGRLLLPIARRRLPPEALDNLMHTMRANRMMEADAAWPLALANLGVAR